MNPKHEHDCHDMSCETYLHVHQPNYYNGIYMQCNILTENAQSDTFKAPCCCFENVPNTALTIVCTINVSIDCNWFDVPNLFTRKNILK